MGRYQAYPEYKDSWVEWLGKVPAEWSIYFGKRIFKSIRESALANDEQLAASQKYGVVPQSLMMELNDSKVMLALKGTESFRHVEKDNFVISLRSFEGGIEHSNFSGCVSPAYTVLSATKLIVPRFYKYLFKSGQYISALQSSTDSLRDGKSISYEQFGRIELVLPSKNEQQAIANFLDHETAKIDTLIEQQQQLIQLLKEKRQAMISHAVTKGLDPDAPMKDSGVEWLGEVPAHWNVVQLKYLVIEGTSGPYGSSLTKSMYSPSGIRVYGQQQVIPNDFSVGDYYISEEKFESMRRYEVFPDDILISVMGTVGRVAVVPQDIERGIINPRLVKYKVDKKKLLPRFLQASILSDVSQSLLLFAAQGSTMDGLNMQILGDLPIAFPVLEEQLEILDEISIVNKKFSLLIEEARRAVELLSERRTALISAAVTGKINVRHFVAEDGQTPQ